MSIENLTIFKVISNFTTELDKVFGNDYRPLKLYAHLINKTTIINDKPIQKHVEAFKEFCITNHEAIITKNLKLIKNPTIAYSQRVFIDMTKIFAMCDKETEEIVWKHLLTLSAIIDPTSKAKTILKEFSNESNSNNSNSEVDFLENIINRIEDNVDPNASPIDSVKNIMNSGVFTELVNNMGDGIEKGQLNLNNLMGTVQKLVVKLGKDEDINANDDNMNVLNTMIGTLQNTNQQMNIANVLGPMMMTLGNQQDSLPNLQEMVTEKSTVTLEE